MKEYRLSYQDVFPEIKVKAADNFITRFKGLMFKEKLDENEGLFLNNCSAIHCCFMRFPIDAVYLDDNMTVVGTETVRPWKLGHFYKGTKHVLELNANAAEKLSPGMRLDISECDEL